MEHDLKTLPNGRLESIAHEMELVQDHLLKLWDCQTYRMRSGDIKRMAEYLTRIRISHSRMRDTLKLFEALLPAIIEAEKKREKLGTPDLPGMGKPHAGIKIMRDTPRIEDATA